MAEIRVVVADDEPLARSGLTRLLSAHDDIAVVGESANGRDAVRTIREVRPDLVFLDVQMPELDGFEVLHALAPQPLPSVVFITAFDDYAVRAFDVHAIDYLVKPFSDQRFAEMLDRARQRLLHSEAAAAARRLAALLADPRPPPHDSTLVATAGRRSVVIAIADIDWIEAEDYCALVHVGKASHILRESIRTLEQRLAPHQFLRVHRSALVNLARVRELHRPAQGEWILVLHDGTELPVSRRLRPMVTRYFASRA